ncbi:MAG: hypothetical protein ACXVCG_18180 [Bdellovibrionota bacterium]
MARNLSVLFLCLICQPAFASIEKISCSGSSANFDVQVSLDRVSSWMKFSVRDKAGTGRPMGYQGGYGFTGQNCIGPHDGSWEFCNELRSPQATLSFQVQLSGAAKSEKVDLVCTQ